MPPGHVGRLSLLVLTCCSSGLAPPGAESGPAWRALQSGPWRWGRVFVPVVQRRRGRGDLSKGPAVRSRGAPVARAGGVAREAAGSTAVAWVTRWVRRGCGWRGPEPRVVARHGGAAFVGAGQAAGAAVADDVPRRRAARDLSARRSSRQGARRPVRRGPRPARGTSRRHAACHGTCRRSHCLLGRVRQGCLGRGPARGCRTLGAVSVGGDGRKGRRER